MNNSILQPPNNRGRLIANKENEDRAIIISAVITLNSSLSTSLHSTHLQHSSNHYALTSPTFTLLVTLTRLYKLETVLVSGLIIFKNEPTFKLCPDELHRRVYECPRQHRDPALNPPYWPITIAL
ncbi:hypothetical protein TNCT_188401 [Trichonephila clavata]|uniref:Uncharacterized protein n=1 Tax=Trichonephila clavata TaxID=2740835 RepID=A0A8X6IXD7_TRICU|nr:hypothetical protein TNCT_188401 [Trichonephila clavata]